MAVFIITGCGKSGGSDGTTPIITPVTDTTSTPIQSPAKETFESGSKADYATSTITLSTGKWSFDNAVIGNTADDRKNGAKSARIQENGKLTMNFDIVNGVYRVAIASATYATDGPSTWQLWASFNGGYSYSQMGNSITTSSSTLQNDTIVVNAVAKARFSIRKVSGGSARLNIDDVEAILTSGPLPPNFADDNNILMGNPTDATPSILDIYNYYMDKTYYSLAYNSDIRIPRWVSWHNQPADFGSTPRQDDFRPDEALPASWYHVANESYTGSGFDRGHSCPSNDRTSSIPANSSTFLMTNIIPQAANLNQGPWANMEDYCHTLVTSSGKEVYVICGSYGVGGTGNNGLLNDIDNGHIAVPAYCWKVVVVLSNGNNDLSRVDNNTRVISVIMPNDNAIGIGANWKNFRVSVNDIEAQIQATGNNIHLLSNLPAAVQSALKSQVDNL
ncbi:MAG: DNA/RNA non-specific endonuclease [Ferruginibacter sp.]